MVHEHQVTIVADSGSCLPTELLEKWRIHIVPHELVIEERTYRDGIDIGPAEFYLLLPEEPDTAHYLFSQARVFLKCLSVRKCRC